MGVVRFGLSKTLTVTIGDTESTSLYIGDMVRGCIEIPSTLTASALRFEVSLDDDDYESLADAERDILDQLTSLSANDKPSIPYHAFNYPYLRVKVGTTQAVADAEITCWLGG